MTQPGDRLRALLRHTADHLPGGPVTAPGPHLVASVGPARRRQGLLLAAVSALVLLAAAAPIIVLDGRESRSPAATSAAPAVDCGTFEVGKGEVLPESAIRCFARALDDRRAVRLEVTLLTAEGDPVTTRYRGGSDGRVEVVTDTTRDLYGPRRIERKVCTGPTPGTVFGFSQCSEPTFSTP
jgi:hypothetical protein